jgi:hypothetical protein
VNVERDPYPTFHVHVPGHGHRERPGQMFRCCVSKRQALLAGESYREVDLYSPLAEGGSRHWEGCPGRMACQREVDDNLAAGDESKDSYKGLVHEPFCRGCADKFRFPKHRDRVLCLVRARAAHGRVAETHVL